MPASLLSGKAARGRQSKQPRHIGLYQVLFKRILHGALPRWPCTPTWQYGRISIDVLETPFNLLVQGQGPISSGCLTAQRQSGKGLIIWASKSQAIVGTTQIKTGRLQLLGHIMVQWPSNTIIKESLTPASYVRRASIMQYFMQSFTQHVYRYIYNYQVSGRHICYQAVSIGEPRLPLIITLPPFVINSL